MPHVAIDHQPKEWLTGNQPFELEDLIRDAVFGIKVLGLSDRTRTSVCIHELANMRPLETWEGEVFVVVSGLFDKPQRTNVVIGQLARAIAEAIMRFAYARARKGNTPLNMVEVIVMPFGGRQGHVFTWVSDNAEERNPNLYGSREVLPRPQTA